MQHFGVLDPPMQLSRDYGGTSYLDMNGSETSFNSERVDRARGTFLGLVQVPKCLVLCLLPLGSYVTSNT
jgi:hypothetical protein